MRLIIAHAGIADLGGLAGHFAHVPGVFFDTSLWSIVDLLDLMRQVAPQQILFATDYPYGRLPNQLLLALRAAQLANFDEAEIRGMLGGTALAIANGAPLPALTAPKGPDALSHSLPLARIHQYISMATPLLWMRQPDRAGGLGLALNAAHEANVDGVPDADLIRHALSVAAELWAGIGEIEDRHESERIARPARHARPHRGHPRGDDAGVTARCQASAVTARLAHRRHRPLDERREHGPLPGALRMAREPGERVGRVERARDVRDAGGDERQLVAAAGGGDRDERERERLPLARAEVRPTRRAARAAAPRRRSRPTASVTSERLSSVGRR